MSGAARVQRWRVRQRAGLGVLSVECDLTRLADCLIAHGLLARDYDHTADDGIVRSRLAVATEKALELLILTSENA